MGLVRILIGASSRSITLFQFRRAIRAHLRPGERLIAYAGAEESPPGAAASGALALVPLGLTLGRAMGLVPEPLTGTFVLTDQRLALVDAAAMFDRPGTRPTWACELERLRVQPRETRVERWFREHGTLPPDADELDMAFRVRLSASTIGPQDAPEHPAFLRRLARGTDFIVTVRPRSGDARLVESLLTLRT